MSYDIILFGHCYDGEIMTTDNDPGDKINFSDNQSSRAFMSGDSIPSRVLKKTKNEFNVVKHKSLIDSKLYLIAVENGFEPSDIDMKISWQNIRPYKK